MGYSNSFKLKVLRSMETVVKNICPVCETEFGKDEKFCSRDGQGLVNRTVNQPVKSLIEEFRKFSDDAAYLLDNSGETNEWGNGGEIEGDIKNFSAKYPKTLFQMDITWDQGFGDPPSRWYIRGGKLQDCKVEVVFEDYDMEKLK